MTEADRAALDRMTQSLNRIHETLEQIEEAVKAKPAQLSREGTLKAVEDAVERLAMVVIATHLGTTEMAVRQERGCSTIQYIREKVADAKGITEEAKLWTADD